MLSRRGLFGAALVAALVVAGASGAHGGEAAALYQAYWAGLSAGEIRLKLRDEPASYRDEITVRSQGLPWLLTHFRATAVSEGRLSAGRPPAPARYDALYDLRKGGDRRLSSWSRRAAPPEVLAEAMPAIHHHSIRVAGSARRTPRGS